MKKLLDDGKDSLKKNEGSFQNSILFTSCHERGTEPMRHEIRRPPKSRRKFGGVWGELAYVCRKISYWLYLREDKTSARRFQSRLEGLLEDVPKSRMAIIRAEGLALFHELRGETSRAIRHRRREINLMERLHRSVPKSVLDDQKKSDYMLGGRTTKCLQERRAMLRSLEGRKNEDK